MLCIELGILLVCRRLVRFAWCGDEIFKIQVDLPHSVTNLSPIGSVIKDIHIPLPTNYL